MVNLTLSSLSMILITRPYPSAKGFGRHLDLFMFSKINCDLGTLDRERLNCGPIQMATEFWLLDIGPCPNGKLDLIQLESDFSHHVDRCL